MYSSNLRKKEKLISTQKANKTSSGLLTNIVVNQLRMVSVAALMGCAVAYFALDAFLDILFDQHAEITFLVLSASVCANAADCSSYDFYAGNLGLEK